MRVVVVTIVVEDGPAGRCHTWDAERIAATVADDLRDTGWSPNSVSVQHFEDPSA